MVYRIDHNKEGTLKIKAKINSIEGTQGGFDAAVTKAREKSEKAWEIEWANKYF